MKKLSVIVMILGLLVTVVSCKSLDDISIGDVTSLASSADTSSVTTAVSGGVDFKKGEVLCATNDNSMKDNYYQVAKVLTAASPATKNQAEVLFLNGKEKWTQFVIPSHKSSKAEMKLGKYLLYSGYSEYEEVSSDSYRKAGWHLGRVTSTDELFKGVVEIKGRKCYVKWVRTPDTIVK